jgi:hypothetical protein
MATCLAFKYDLPGALGVADETAGCGNVGDVLDGASVEGKLDVAANVGLSLDESLV